MARPPAWAGAGEQQKITGGTPCRRPPHSPPLSRRAAAGWWLAAEEKREEGAGRRHVGGGDDDRRLLQTEELVAPVPTRPGAWAPPAPASDQRPFPADRTTAVGAPCQRRRDADAPRLPSLHRHRRGGAHTPRSWRRGGGGHGCNIGTRAPFHGGPHTNHISPPHRGSAAVRSSRPQTRAGLLRSASTGRRWRTTPRARLAADQRGARPRGGGEGAVSDGVPERRPLHSRRAGT